MHSHCPYLSHLQGWAAMTFIPVNGVLFCVPTPVYSLPPPPRTDIHPLPKSWWGGCAGCPGNPQGEVSGNHCALWSGGSVKML